MKDKKLVKKKMEEITANQGWQCVLITYTRTLVAGDDVLVVFYKQISENPDVLPCNRYEIFINDVHRNGGVIR